MSDGTGFTSPSSQPPGGGAGEAVACLRRAAEVLGEVAGADIPPGAEHTVGEDLIQVLRGLDEVKLAAADAAGVFEARGGLVGSGQFRLSHWLQHTAHRSPAEARQLASLAHRSAHLEESEQAYQQGEISLAKLERIAHWVNEGLACRSVQRWPEAEAFAHTAEGPLLGLACEPGVTVWGLDQVGRRLRYTLDPSRQEKEYQDRYAGRGARFIRGMDDSFHLEAWGDEASGDVLRNALDAFLAPPATEGEERSSYQRTHDALVEMCQTVVELPAEQAPRRRAGANPVALVVGLDLLQGQEGAGPAVSEYGTLWPASAARAHATDGVLRRVVTDPVSGQPLDVGYAQRLFSPAVRTALLVQRQRCAWQGGCDRPIAWCQADHKVAWWDGGPSDLSNAQPLCRFHNLEKEHRRARERGWAQRPAHGTGPTPAAAGAGRPELPRRTDRPDRGARPPAEESGGGEGGADRPPDDTV
ncbi:hypothetical protein CDO52_03150 [Nocardiopsis gilva YIM 90087]|uniref:HNH nuclease domain-containing protein n=1 Tax=Nocardiopsis gilva YIM 90087 TaxID=1235441 RepID=A0A223S1C0_9ACTN|nr:HNH endonuclease signature motif containing protein [Nocardiopsis gilva]ASU81911.1 hypothetical protein CDO52_03150 [Nocardiopsis gilva YIM 90087]